MLYQERPIIVKATQWHKKGDHEAVFFNGGIACIQTVQGLETIDPSDWIIEHHAQRELMTDKAFNEKYELVRE
jgi:hypothetical protein